MANFRYEWFLFNYKDGVPDVMSKAFKAKADAEKAREKYPVKERGGIGVGVRRIPISTPKRKT
jgi:hypothetical protein